MLATIVRHRRLRPYILRIRVILVPRCWGTDPGIGAGLPADGFKFSLIIEAKESIDGMPHNGSHVLRSDELG